MTKNLKPVNWPETLKGNELSLEELNELFEPLDYLSRIKNLYRLFTEEEVLFTSSFGTKSILLLHSINMFNPNQQVHFINTTYHFDETLNYMNLLKEQLSLKVKEVLPNKQQNDLTKEEQWWKDHPKMCCTINKVAPMEPIISEHLIWVSGLMANQTKFRSHLRVFEQQGDIIKFHPLIDIDEGEFLYHLDYYKLPKHPLQNEGYGSVGCVHCTAKGEGRSGRWKNKKKQECGLHPNYYKKKNK